MTRTLNWEWNPDDQVEAGPVEPICVEVPGLIDITCVGMDLKRRAARDGLALPTGSHAVFRYAFPVAAFTGSITCELDPVAALYALEEPDMRGVMIDGPLEGKWLESRRGEMVKVDVLTGGAVAIRHGEVIETEEVAYRYAELVIEGKVYPFFTCKGVDPAGDPVTEAALRAMKGEPDPDPAQDIAARLLRHYGARSGEPD